MKVVIQRVSQASVTINGEKKGSINNGLLILLGIVNEDNQDDISWLCKKIANLRIFPDENQVMNRSLIDVDGQALVVSQFTLHASTKKGNRPSYILAARPEVAIPLYEQFISELQSLVNQPIRTGEFGADMKVDLRNDGPVTIIIDSKNRV
ncbi:MAG: D-tyrosyl-tRNA(Tyr) deacylase [Psychroserpens sp.]|nr:D-tyrosyl-tRNA(Tyr) deacylase [Psychroserpens sp.]